MRLTPTASLQPQESRAAAALRDLQLSGRPLVWVHTPEEQRVSTALQDIAGSTPCWTWSLTEGMVRGGDTGPGQHMSPRAALDFIADLPDAAIIHLKDFHEALDNSAEIRRRIRDLYARTGPHKFVVISSPVREIPKELERSIVLLQLRPPDALELAAFVRHELEGYAVPEETVNQMARSLQGLTLDESRYALRRALALHPNLTPETVHALLDEKRLVVNRSGVIEYIDAGTRMHDVGGLENLKKWLLERQKLFQLRDTLSVELVPKGVLFMGIPGCGKSLCVKAIASHFQLPLYRVDMTEIFSGRHGKPEGAFVQACRMLEDVAPAILWFDEIEMSITSSETAGEQGRIFAFFLTWMQEKTRGLFVAATANRVDLLPAEMLRKGRFDEVFFVDLPGEDERLEIFRIHLRSRGEDPGRFDLPQLMQFTAGWSGAEVEQCVVSSLTRARLADRDLSQQDLVNIAVTTVPLSRTMKEQITHIRAWAFERAVRASPKAARA
ncbi:MAG TPA: AAA family ATPase [Bryobacteraceae bacterium]|nr:AAA family ATPase [Bryobacteraceae bacterium]